MSSTGETKPRDRSSAEKASSNENATAKPTPGNLTL